MSLDGNTKILAGAAVLIGAAWWWNRQGTSSADSGQAASSTAVDLFTSDLTFGISDLTMNLGIDTMSIWTPPASAGPYLSAIAAAETRYNLPNNMLARLLYQESRFRPEIIDGTKTSAAGALGIAQFMPATARQFGINPLDPFQSIDAAGKYMAQLYRQFGNWGDALAAYNWGPGNVKRRGTAAAPAETQSYFTQILADLGLGGTTA